MGMFWYNMGAAVVFFFCSVCIIHGASEMPPPVSGTISSGFWPGILGAALLLLSLGLVIQTLWRRHAAARQRRNGEGGKSIMEEAAPIEFRSPGMRKVYALCGIFLVFCAILYWVNFMAGAVFISFACAWLQGERVWWKLLAITLGLPAAMHVIFVWILRLPLP